MNRYTKTISHRIALMAFACLVFALVGCDSEAANESFVESDANGLSVRLSEVEANVAEGGGEFAEVDLSSDLVYDLELYVDPALATESGDGSKERPYGTLAEAFSRINSTRSAEANMAGDSGSASPYVEPSIHLRVAPGIYREGGLSIGNRDSAVLIESSDPSAEVVISGADVWDEWSVSHSDSSLLAADWPYKWGEASFKGWPPDEMKNLTPIGKRSEMVFVNGVSMTQVEPVQNLGRGKFYVDFETRKLVLRLPHGVNADDATIEVSIRPHLLLVGSVNGLTLRNFVFTQACSGDMHPGLGAWAVLMSGEPDETPPDHTKAPVLVKSDRNFLRNVVIDNCRFEWNNGSGLTMANFIGLKVKNSSFDNNGVTGMSANRAKDIIFEDCTFDGNNWRRGKLGKAYGWAPAGTKQLFMDNVVYRRCSFSRNYAVGLWLDFGNENILVDDCVIEDNWNVGLYYESSYGPLLVKNTDILRNAFSTEADFAIGGVLFAESQQMTLDNCLIADNANYQIGVRSRLRPSSGYWSQTLFDGLCENLTVKNSTIRGIFYAPDNTPEWFNDEHRTSSLIAQSVHAMDDWYKKLLPTYVGENNTFIHGHSEAVFGVGGNYGLTRVDLSGWQEATGQDLDSSFHTLTPRASWQK